MLNINRNKTKQTLARQTSNKNMWKTNKMNNNQKQEQDDQSEQHEHEQDITR